MTALTTSQGGCSSEPRWAGKRRAMLEAQRMFLFVKRSIRRWRERRASVLRGSSTRGRYNGCSMVMGKGQPLDRREWFIAMVRWYIGLAWTGEMSIIGRRNEAGNGWARRGLPWLSTVVSTEQRGRMGPRGGGQLPRSWGREAGGGGGEDGKERAGRGEGRGVDDSGVGGGLIGW